MHHRAILWTLGWVLIVPGCSTNRPVPSSSGQPRSYSEPHTEPPGEGPVQQGAVQPSPSPPGPIAPPPLAAAVPAAATAANASAGMAPPAGSAPSGLTALREPDTDTHAVRGLSGGNPRSSVAPNVTTIPSPPATLSVPPNAGVEATLKAVPAGIPVGHLTKAALEGPLRDPTRFARCRKPATVRIDIDAIIYNGSALGVSVQTAPNDQALKFCVERIVRETTWIKELAVNRVTVSL